MSTLPVIDRSCRHELLTTLAIFAGLAAFVVLHGAFHSAAESASVGTSSLPGDEVKVAVNEASFLPFEQDWVAVDCKKNQNEQTRQCRKKVETVTRISTPAGFFAHAP